MTSTAGEYSPAQLARLVNELVSKVRETRRENMAPLVAELDQLSQLIAAELRLDEEILNQERARFKAEFSFLDRINPFNVERKEAHARDVKPLNDEVRQDKALMTRCCELLEWTRNASEPIEWRTNWHGGIAGVYNEHTGQADWREAWHTGIAGVYHPDRRCVEWREQWKHGVAGVFNPVTREIEWRESWHGGIFGVFNPKMQEIEWRESWHHGICGIYNPVSEVVEWKESWKGGVAGAWCPQLNQVQWHECWHHGAACLYFDGSTYRSSGSYYGDEDD